MHTHTYIPLQKRARILIRDFVAGKPLEGPVEVNRVEPVLLPASMCMQPRVHIGTMGAREALRLATNEPLPSKTGDSESTSGSSYGATASQPKNNGAVSSSVSNGGGVIVESFVGSGAHVQVDALLRLYAKEQHVLIWDRRQGEAVVLLQETASGNTLLRALWQAEWLHYHQQEQRQVGGRAEGEMELLTASLAAVNERFGSFMEEARGLGWDVETVQIETGPVRIRLH